MDSCEPTLENWKAEALKSRERIRTLESLLRDIKNGNVHDLNNMGECVRGCEFDANECTQEAIHYALSKSNLESKS